MTQTITQPPSPHLNGQGLKIGIVVARFNWSVTGAVLEETQKTLQHLGVAASDITVSYAPGSFELAFAARTLIAGDTYHAVICIGCIMKGATRHDILVGDAAAQGIQRVALDSGVPVIFGVICAENQQQAEERIVRGTEYAEAAIEMAQNVLAVKKTSKQ